MSNELPTSDTDPAVEAALIERIRNLAPEERLRQMMIFCQFGRDLVAADIRRQFPDANETEFKRAFLTRLYGEEFAGRAMRGGGS